MKYGLVLGNIKTMTRFVKTFETEFERDKFERKLKYSKKIVVLGKC